MSGARWSVRHEGGSIGAYSTSKGGSTRGGSTGGQYRVLTRGHTGEDGRVQHEWRSIERTA